MAENVTLKDPSKDEVLRQMNRISVNLPPPDTKRWVARRKAMIVNAVHSGAMSLEEVCRYYALSVEEFVTWQRAIETHGIPGLRVTRPQTIAMLRRLDRRNGGAERRKLAQLRADLRIGDPMRALIVAADVITAASIKMALAEENLICDTTDLGEHGLEIGTLHDYDIILLDLTRRGLQGLEVLRWLRAAGLQTPILMVSDLADLHHKIKGLGFSADDFLTTPLDRRELVARVRAIARRSKARSESTIQAGKLLVNLDTRVVTIDDQPVRLTGKEYAILELLCLHKDTTLTKEMLLEHLYGGIDEPGLKIIDIFVCHLRKKLAQATAGNHYIETVWGRGYRLRDPASMSAAKLAVRPEDLGAHHDPAGKRAA
jgi:two-component system, cell cycle response regulator CtrA